MYKEESYRIIGLCMEIHRELGSGFSEVVYKDALEYELRQQKIAFEREKEFQVRYKDTILKHHFYADLVVMDKIILEAKAVTEIQKIHLEQTMNYLYASDLPLALLVNFRGTSLQYRRLVLT